MTLSTKIEEKKREGCIVARTIVELVDVVVESAVTITHNVFLLHNCFGCKLKPTNLYIKQIFISLVTLYFTTHRHKKTRRVVFSLAVPSTRLPLSLQRCLYHHLSR